MSETHRRFVALFICGLLVSAVTASQQPRTAALFQADQAAAGRAQYRESCGACHGLDLSGTTNAPPLAGTDFLNAWASRSTQDLLEYMRSAMPPTAPGNLGERAYLDIAAYILQSNGGAAGPNRFAPSASAAIGSLRLGGRSTRPPASDDRPAAASARAAGVQAARDESGVNREIKSFRPVTDADLLKPPDGDWLNWRRTLDGWGYSPLRAMN